MNQLNKMFDNVKMMFDIGLWNQLALIKKCDLHISPHSGFSFLAPRVLTPWLEISGGFHTRYLWNMIPFYCSVDKKTFRKPFSSFIGRVTELILSRMYI